MDARFTLMKGIIEEFMQPFSDNITRMHEKENNIDIIATVEDQNASIHSEWNLIPIILNVKDSLIKVSLPFYHYQKKYRISSSSLKKKILMLIVEINLLIDIGMFKYNNTQNSLKFESSLYYKDLLIVSWKASIKDLVSNSLNTFRKYKNVFIENFTSQSSTVVEHIRVNPIIHFEEFKEEDNLYEMKEIDPEVLNIFKNAQDNQHIIAYDSVFFDKKTGKHVYSLRWPLVYYQKSGIIQMPDKFALTYFASELQKLRNQNIFFKKFPVKSIEHRGIENTDNDKGMKLGFNQIEKYLSPNLDSTSQNRDQEKISFQHSLTMFLLKIMKSRKTPSSNPNIFDRIDESKLDHDIERDKEIGKGGFGKVYKNTYCGYDVAIKLSLSNRSDTNNKKFIAEHYLTKSLSHPNVIKSYGFVLLKDKRFGIVLEYCENSSLTHFYKENKLIKQEVSVSTSEIIQELSKEIDYTLFLSRKPIEASLPLGESVKEMYFYHNGRLAVLKMIGNGLSYIHSRNIAHFDMKPHNILLGENGMPKIADFGLSKVIMKPEDCKAAGSSLYYSPPEQVVNNSPDKSADVWGFGMTIYYMLVGRNPFDSLRAKLRKNKALEKQKYFKCVHHDLARPTIDTEFEESKSRVCALMRACWNLDKAKRPKMNECVKELGRIRTLEIEGNDSDYQN